MHNWYACSHARPTFCNVCRESLSGVTSHGLSCEGKMNAFFPPFIILCTYLNYPLFKTNNDSENNELAKSPKGEICSLERLSLGESIYEWYGSPSLCSRCLFLTHFNKIFPSAAATSLECACLGGWFARKDRISLICTWKMQMCSKIVLLVCRISIPQEKKKNHNGTFCPTSIKIINALSCTEERFIALKILSCDEGVGMLNAFAVYG